jgi:ABC-type transport system involved in cytochrome c biogenesis permease subunit
VAQVRKPTDRQLADLRSWVIAASNVVSGVLVGFDSQWNSSKSLQQMGTLVGGQWWIAGLFMLGAAACCVPLRLRPIGYCLTAFAYFLAGIWYFSVAVKAPSGGNGLALVAMFALATLVLLGIVAAFRDREHRDGD